MTPHTDNCGRSGNPESVTMNCKMDCACWCHKGCKLDVELTEGNWHTLKTFDNVAQAERLAADLSNAGIGAMVSCACGAYAYGECGLCAA